MAMGFQLEVRLQAMDIAQDGHHPSLIQLGQPLARCRESVPESS